MGPSWLLVRFASHELSNTVVSIQRYPAGLSCSGVGGGEVYLRGNSHVKEVGV